MSKHVGETDLALYAAGDLPLWRRAQVWFHVHSCVPCLTTLLSYKAAREELLARADKLPEGLDWDRLSAEMTANIHVGLAAGECVAPRTRKAPFKDWSSSFVSAPRW